MDLKIFFIMSTLFMIGFEPMMSEVDCPRFKGKGLSCSYTGLEISDTATCYCTKGYFMENGENGIKYECSNQNRWYRMQDGNDIFDSPECRKGPKCPPIPLSPKLSCRIAGYGPEDYAWCYCDRPYYMDLHGPYNEYDSSTKGISYKCSDSRWKRDDGSWNETMPTCKVDCPKLRLPWELHCNISGYKIEDKAECKCLPEAEYKMEGVSILVCGTEGKWSAELPKCKKITTTTRSTTIKQTMSTSMTTTTSTSTTTTSSSKQTPSTTTTTSTSSNTASIKTEGKKDTGPSPTEDETTTLSNKTNGANTKHGSMVVYIVAMFWMVVMICSRTKEVLMLVIEQLGQPIYI